MKEYPENNESHNPALKKSHVSNKMASMGQHSIVICLNDKARRKNQCQKITFSLQNFFPLLQMGNEEPFTIPIDKDPELTLDQLKAYYESLDHT